MSLSKKRKIDAECRVFQDKWTECYFFTNVNGKAVCLVCHQQVSVLKEYNVRRHYETQHSGKFKSIQGKSRTDKVKELLSGLKKQQSVFTHTKEVSDAAVKASYLIAKEIAVASKPFSDGEFVKNCMLKAAEVVCPEKRQAFANISLTRNTIADRISDLSANVDNQLKEKVASFVAFSIAIDESTDVTDIAQLAVFIRGVDASLTITEEFIKLVPMTGTTTGEDIFNSLVGALDNIGVDWARAVSIATDGAPSMTGKRVGVVAKLKEKVNAANGGHDFHTFHCIIHEEALCCKTLKMKHVMEVVFNTVNFIRARGLNHRQFDQLLNDDDISYGLPYHTEVRWLSRGVVLKRFFELRKEIADFMDMKGKPVEQLQSPEWLQDLAFMVDITDHLNCLNKMLQGRNKVVTQYYDNIRAFKSKLVLWEMQFSKNSPVHFPFLKELYNTGTVTELGRYKESISSLLQEFERRFQVFSELEQEFKIFCSPFTVTSSDVPTELQMEIIDLQCDSNLKEKFTIVGLDIYKYLFPGYPKLRDLAAKILCMFGTTYLCEQLFSVMAINKNKLRSRLTNKNLNDILKVAASQELSPNIDTLVKEKRCQVSGSN